LIVEKPIKIELDTKLIEPQTIQSSNETEATSKEIYSESDVKTVTRSATEGSLIGENHITLEPVYDFDESPKPLLANAEFDSKQDKFKSEFIKKRSTLTPEQLTQLDKIEQMRVKLSTMKQQREKDKEKEVLLAKLHEENFKPNGITLKLGINVTSCGIKKDWVLPIALENHYIDRGNFGDDAGFWCEHEDACVIGLADGATGNIMYGYDPGDFPRNLMKISSNLFSKDKSLKDPKNLLLKAYDIVQDKECFGSSTACILVFDHETHNVDIAYVGDSGYRLIRGGIVIQKSTPQKVSADCPRQLDSYPWKVETRKMGISFTDILSDDTICENFKMEKDDIVILSSDGLFDNLEDDEIEKIVEENKSNGQLAEQLILSAVNNLRKPDDILLIIGTVGENKKSTDHSIYSKEYSK